MEIKLMQYEVLEAIEDYIKKNHSFEIDINDRLEEYPSIAYLERTYGPQKYKNGQVKKHPEHGFVLNEIIKTEQKYITFGEDCDFSFYITGK